ncbi:LHFPL tetraspan subfamily member 6 protein-like [Sycon ciliatum]|uniref:LHFPL tetraspan subfamily member 6 protein-like n=1 Tax=Sycon ciliatum TaxID=27933 RepID=UPI0031F6AA89
MCGSMTACGWLWATISIAAAGAACTSFYWADWVHGQTRLPYSVGQNATFRFGLFRRCNYIQVNQSSTSLNQEVTLRTECGRYQNFDDIPSVYWQTSTVLFGVAAGLLVLVALTAFFALFLEDVCNKTLSRAAGVLQGVAALSMAVTLFLYPVGWDAESVKDEACGPDAGSYKPGSCSIGVAFYIGIGATVVAILATVMSPLSQRKKTRSDYVI